METDTIPVNRAALVALVQQARMASAYLSSMGYVELTTPAEWPARLAESLVPFADLQE